MTCCKIKQMKMIDKVVMETMENVLKIIIIIMYNQDKTKIMELDPELELEME